MTPTEIRELRESCELTQEGFAKLIGTRQKDICRWETGAVKPGKRWTFVLTDIRDHRDEPDIQRRIQDAYWT